MAPARLVRVALLLAKLARRLARQRYRTGMPGRAPLIASGRGRGRAGNARSVNPGPSAQCIERCVVLRFDDDLYGSCFAAGRGTERLHSVVEPEPVRYEGVD